MFERLGGYTELLLPSGLLSPGSVLARLVEDIPEEDWKDQVEIIGWLYQYYNTEPKEETFALLKKNVKITKERIPSATQMFTPDWIVRYMVENSLGRLWLDRHCEGASAIASGASAIASEASAIASEASVIASEAKQSSDFQSRWKYYIEEAEQPPEATTPLRTAPPPLRATHPPLRAAPPSLRAQRSNPPHPEQIKFIDPCMGSGHILAYAFDVLLQIYESSGYAARDAARLILENNLYGLDIDKRAYQLAYFALMMKARAHNRRILDEGVKPQVYHPEGDSDAEMFGSLLVVGKLEPMPQEAQGQLSLEDMAYDDKLRLWNFKRLLAQKYDVVCTNPPYMGSKGMNAKLAQFVKDNYPDSKSDLFAAFMERAHDLTMQAGYTAMITQHAWMFLSSYEKLREKLRQSDTVNMAHLGHRAFAEIAGDVVQSTTFVMRKNHIAGYKGIYIRLVDCSNAEEKEAKYLETTANPSSSDRYTANAENFAKIPGSPVAYWVGDAISNAFEKGMTFESFSLAIVTGIIICDNNRFLRFWHEVGADKIELKWNLYSKGGAYRKWFGNVEYVVNWENDASELRAFGSRGSRLCASKYQGKEHFVWTSISSSKTGFRKNDRNIFFDQASHAIVFPKDSNEYLLGFANSVVAECFLTFIAPTINFTPGDIKSLPLITSGTNENNVKVAVAQNINLSRADWDAFETSWDFKSHPLV
ncbi:MAG: N-6 DNA methylase [Clostridiales Family XIII bacterium]|nr:N-6 DNA methylase [Clostridiales Family XIII bacterium]